MGVPMPEHGRSHALAIPTATLISRLSNLFGQQSVTM